MIRDALPLPALARSVAHRTAVARGALPSPGSARRRGARALLALWVVALTVLVATTMAGHLLALPRPARDDRAVAALVARVAGGAPLRGWTVTHVLYAGCACSRRIVAQLVARPRVPWITEQVALVPDPGDDVAATLRAAGLRVLPLDAEALRGHHLEAAPAFVVSAPDGAVRYVGGYTPRKQGPAPQDRAVAEALRRGDEVTPIPIFGCAVSARLRRDIDPLGRWRDAWIRTVRSVAE